jgi:hypothetical protein
MSGHWLTLSDRLYLVSYIMNPILAESIAMKRQCDVLWSMEMKGFC